MTRFRESSTDAAVVDIIVRDEKAAYVLVNITVANLYGIDASEMIGATDLELAAEDGDMVEYLKEIHISGMRARDPVQQILAFAHQSEEAIKPVQVSRIVKGTVKLMRSTAPATVIRPISGVLGGRYRLRHPTGKYACDL